MISENIFTANTRTVLFGNSLVAQSTGGNSSQIAYQSFTFFPWLTLLLKGVLYLPPTGNKGVSGNTTSQMVARLGDAIALEPKLTIIEAGTNDLGAFSAQQIINNLARIYKAFTAAGSKVIMVTILPRFGSEALTPENEAKRITINNYLKSIVDPDVSVIDADIVISDNIYFIDGLHLNSTGGYTLAKFIADQTAMLFCNLPKPTDALTADRSNNPNIYFTGTAGSKSGGATGVVATDYILEGKDITGLTTVGSIKTVDGVNSQILSISGNYTGSNLTVDLNVIANGTLPVTNDVIEGLAEYMILVNDLNVLTIDVCIVIFNPSYGLLNVTESMTAVDQLSNKLEINTPYISRTPSIKVLPGTTAEVNIKVSIILKNQVVMTPMNFEIEIKSMGIRNIKPSHV